MKASFQPKLYSKEINSQSVQISLQEEFTNGMIRNIHQNKRIITSNKRKGFLSPTSQRNSQEMDQLNVRFGDSNKEIKEKLLQQNSSDEIEQQSQQIPTEKQNYKTPMIINNKKVPRVFQNYLDVKNNQANQNYYKQTKYVNESVNQDEVITSQKQIRIRRVKSPKAEILTDKKNQKQFNIIKQNDDSMDIPDFDYLVLNHQAKKMLQPIKAIQISRGQNFFQMKSEIPNIQKRNSVLNPSILQQLKINEMATIFKYNTTKNSQLKKVIHIPTLQSFTIKESLINETSASIMEQIKLWNKFEESSQLFAKIINIYWNTPEGSHSILMEFSDIISLQNIIDTCGCLPESIIQSIAKNIFDIFGVINDHSQKQTFAHELINPSTIYFNKENQLKLYFQDELLDLKTQTPYFTFKTSICQYYNESGFSKYDLCASERKNQCIDYTFEIGLLSLYLALGDLSLTLNTKQQFCCLNNQDQQKENLIENCCLLHSIEHIAKFGSRINKLQNKNIQLLLKYYTVEQCQIISKILHKKYSQNFRNFLCMCLQYQKNGQSFEKINKIVSNSVFFENRKLKTNQFKIEDLKKIVQPFRNQLNAESELNRICSTFQIILPSCSEWFEQLSGLRLLQNFLNLKPESDFIRALAQDLFLSSELVCQKLATVIKQSDIFPLKKRLMNQQNAYLKKQTSGTTTASSSIKSNHTEIISEKNEI